MRIDIAVFDGLDELDVVGPLEVLRGAASGSTRLDVRLAGRDGVAPVQGAFGLTFTPDVAFSPGAAEVVVVPGGGWAVRADRGAWGEVRRGDWLPLLADAAAAGSLMSSVCTGAMLLAHAGVVGARTATTHRAAMDDLAATGATVVDARVVDAGPVITGGGVTSGIDVGLHLVERLLGADAAADAARRLEYRRQPVLDAAGEVPPVS
jgi:transcriptional regulator GlxA family with amidase domain